MYHSLIFIDGETVKNTWDDWHLIPSSRPNVEQPSPSYKYVDIPGRNGSLDLSDYLTGSVAYSDRSGSFTFYVANEDPETLVPFNRNWASFKQTLAQFFNGRKILKMKLEDDPNYYYKGRFFMKAWSTGDNFSQISIEYRVDPFKYRVSNDRAVIG